MASGLESDVAKAAPSLTLAQRDALVDWLRNEEWHLRICGRGGDSEAALLSRCRKGLGDAETVTAGTLPSMMRPFAHVVDLQWERTRRKQMAARVTEDA